MFSKEIYLLDCTLRDGGYLNNWRFTPEYVQEYVDSLGQYDVDIAEIGFRYNIKDDNYGICAYCPDEFIESLDIPDDLEIAVMIKADQFAIWQDLHKLFADKKNSRVDMVRIAVHHEQSEISFRLAEILKNKGYKVAINLTKFKRKNSLKKSLNFDCDILYLADTFGELFPDDIKRLIDAVRQQYKGFLGFHGHNNHGLALQNTITAIENGVKYIDSTINGVGKGAGNLKTEDIAKELKNERQGLHILQNN